MGFITYKQADSRWGRKNYNGSSSMSTAGCGPTSCAMIIYGIDGKTTPLDTMKYMQKNGFAIRNNGTAWSGIPSCLKAFGLKNVQSVPDMAKCWELMSKGYVGVFLFRSGSRGGVTWTTSGHYIAVTDYKVKNGKHYIYTRDSGGRNHTGWYCYETQMRGLIPQIWLGKIESPEQTLEPTPESGTYQGTFPSLKVKKTTAQVIADACTWAKWVASDNRFHYGYTSKDKKINAHHNGCYFCGTNTTKGGRSKKGIVDYQYTYCCNPFVHACFAHGGLVRSMLTICKKGSSYDFTKGHGYDKSTIFDNLGHPKMSSLKAGDVLCKDSHVALYVGNGYLAEASGGDDNKRNSKRWNNSIAVKKMSASRYKGFKRVHRFNASVNCSHSITLGDISDDVLLLQKYLNWYGIKVSEDRIYGFELLDAVKKFQSDNGLKADGVVGETTLAKMKEIKR